MMMTMMFIGRGHHFSLFPIPSHLSVQAQRMDVQCTHDMKYSYLTLCFNLLQASSAGFTTSTQPAESE